MKTILRIFIVIISLVIILLVVGLFLPSKVSVERTIIINTPAKTPFEFVNKLELWKLWSPWHQLDSTATWEFSNPSEGANAWYTWQSNHDKVGNGKMMILRSQPDSLIEASMQFEDWTPASVDFIFEEKGDATKVTWTMNSDMGYNLVGRWFGLFMDKMVGVDYEKGLANLKQVSELKPKTEQVAGFDVELKEMPAQKYFYIENSNVKPGEIAIKIGEGFMKLDAFTKQNKFKVTGYPFTIWTNMNNFSAAFPVAEDAYGLNEIKFRSEEPFSAYVLKYYGAYDKNMHVYEEMDQFLVLKGLKQSGPPREIYVTDPMMEKDTAKWLTEMIFPVSN